MALHDVDRNNDDRTSPAVNAHDTQDIEQRMAHGTLSTQPTTDPTEKTRIVFKKNLILTYDDAGRVSSVYGYAPGLVNYPVLIIANYGYDVYVDILGLIPPTV